MFALIMAGGSGTRLWPVSRKQSPKQLLGFIGKKTLLQNTFDRLVKGFSTKEIFIATTTQYATQIKKQLPKIPATHYSLEPELKDRGPAIALAALLMYREDPTSSFVTAWSDHYIKDEPAYFKALKLADTYLDTNPSALVTIGIKPDHPHVGFGYIQLGSKIPFLKKKGLGETLFRVKSFTEKPDLKTAEKFLKNGKYLWNTGYFICKTGNLLSLYQRHLPQIYDVLMKIKPYIGTKKQHWAIAKFYPEMPKVDIEKGLIEKLTNVAVIPAQFDWADVGSWKIIHDVLSLASKKSEPRTNTTQGNITVFETTNSLIYNYEPKLVAVVGMDDIAVINTKDTLLIIKKDKSEKVKDLVKRLEEDKNLRKYL